MYMHTTFQKLPTSPLLYCNVASTPNSPHISFYSYLSPQQQLQKTHFWVEKKEKKGGIKVEIILCYGGHAVKVSKSELVSLGIFNKKIILKHPVFKFPFKITTVQWQYHPPFSIVGRCHLRCLFLCFQSPLTSAVASCERLKREEFSQKYSIFTLLEYSTVDRFPTDWDSKIGCRCFFEYPFSHISPEPIKVKKKERHFLPPPLFFRINPNSTHLELPKKVDDISKTFFKKKKTYFCAHQNCITGIFRAVTTATTMVLAWGWYVRMYSSMLVYVVCMEVKPLLWEEGGIIENSLFTATVLCMIRLHYRKLNIATYLYDTVNDSLTLFNNR